MAPIVYEKSCLKSLDIYGDLSVVQATPSKALKRPFGGRVLSETVDLNFAKADASIVSWSH